MANDIEFTNMDFEEDKYSRFKLISWWDQDILKNAKIMVVGAGALGNELVKNLALLGVGNVFVFDMDKIESTNLTRSVLFRMSDVGKYKAEVISERAEEINPDVKVIPFVANIIDDVGLGVYRRMDVVLGGLDNREARLSINQNCYRVNKPWIDGAIEVLNGFARVFVPGQGACYECTMTETDWMLINKRKSCALLSNEQMNEGKIPTTPTSSSVIAGIQVQEMLKLLHSERKLPILAGKGYVFNGLTHDSYVVEYQEKPDCMSHDIYPEIEEKQWSVHSESIKTVADQIKSDMGENVIVEIDRDIATNAECTCGESKVLLVPVHKLNASMLTCSKCGKQMRFNSKHTFDGTEDYSDKTFGEIGIPPLHVVKGRQGIETKYYEFTADYDLVFGKK
ncbi:adenylyltransferase and sulfurtransferase [Lachnospiraceae bacterium]|nr:adenylyltransferase and sulfurtransferase [Lachnospiraceae bacterium]